MIHSAKIYTAVPGGVKIFDCRTMTKRVIKNSWYTDEELDKLLGLDNKRRVSARTSSGKLIGYKITIGKFNFNLL
jgi:hypothetical protein